MVDITDYRPENDHISLKGDSSISKFIKNDEVILFTDGVIKINRYGIKQNRNILITSKGVYNLKDKELKRRIDFKNIKGITCTKSTEEFVIHCIDLEYDYYYISQRLKNIIESIGAVYLEMNKSELPLCVIDTKSLNSIVTSKKEKQKDINFSRMPQVGLVPIREYLYGETNLNFNENTKDGRSNTIISKKKGFDSVGLDDFSIIKILGRGTMGKVSLVEFKPTKEVYAMKSLKKDVLLTQDQVENTLLEKKILENLEHPNLVGLVFCFQTNERVYFVMPFIKGGELFQHLRKFRVFDEEK